MCQEHYRYSWCRDAHTQGALHHDPNAAARGDSEASQVVRELVGLGINLPVVQQGLPVHEAGAVGAGGRPVLKQLDEGSPLAQHRQLHIGGVETCHDLQAVPISIESPMLGGPDGFHHDMPPLHRAPRSHGTEELFLVQKPSKSLQE